MDFVLTVIVLVVAFELLAQLFSHLDEVIDFCMRHWWLKLIGGILYVVSAVAGALVMAAFPRRKR